MRCSHTASREPGDPRSSEAALPWPPLGSPDGAQLHSIRRGLAGFPLQSLLDELPEQLGALAGLAAHGPLQPPQPRQALALHLAVPGLEVGTLPVGGRGALSGHLAGLGLPRGLSSFRQHTLLPALSPIPSPPHPCVSACQERRRAPVPRVRNKAERAPGERGPGAGLELDSGGRGGQRQGRLLHSLQLDPGSATAGGVTNGKVLNFPGPSIWTTGTTQSLPLNSGGARRG